MIPKGYYFTFRLMLGTRIVNCSESTTVTPNETLMLQLILHILELLFSTLISCGASPYTFFIFLNNEIPMSNRTSLHNGKQ